MVEHDGDVESVHEAHTLIEEGSPALHIVFYSTGHGFGHASRDLEVVRAVHALDPSVRIHLRTPVAGWFIDSALGDVPHTRSEARLDVGVVQRDGITQDLAATAQACEDLLAREDVLIEEERRFLADMGATAVVSDIPALPLAAAADLGIPAIALSNFTWSWIYADQAAEEPRLAAVAERFERAYARADLLLRLPFSADAVARPFREVASVPMVARQSRLDPTDARRRLGVDEARPMVLVTFGGLGISQIDLQGLAKNDGYQFVLTPPGPRDPRLRVVDSDEMRARGLQFADLVRASDVVVSKPGYGIVSECLANETRFMYTSRGAFAEYPLLVDALEAHGVSQFIDNTRLASGDWDEALGALMARPRRPCGLRVDGGEAAARALLQRFAGGGPAG